MSTVSYTKYAIVFSSQYITDTINGRKTSRNDWLVEDIRNLIESNDQFVLNCLLKLYSLQTEDEKECEQTVNHNGLGFNGYDAKPLTNIAKQCCEARFITFRQINFVRTRILKYAKQLTKIANGEI